MTLNKIAAEIAWMLANTMEGATPEQALECWIEEGNGTLSQQKKRAIIAKIEW